MSAATLTLGPWPKGLNLTSNRDLSPFLEPTELGEATNVILTKEGFIAPRPGCKVVTSNVLYQHMGTDGVMKLLGSVRLPNGSMCTFVLVYAGGTSYVYKAFSPQNMTLYFSAPGVRFTHVLMHKGKADHEGIIFFADADNKSYKTPDFSAVAVPTAITTGAIPGSDGGIIVKDRLFLIKGNTSKFMWSPATNILDWTKVDDPNTVGDDVAGHEFIEATHERDGIMSVEFVNNSFYIFKKTKTYMFTYQVKPVDDGYLRKISNEFGALDSTLYRGVIVVLNNKGVFRVENTEFIDLQSKLNLRFEIPIDHNNIRAEDVFVTDFNNDILVGYRDVNSRLSSPEMLWNDMWDDMWEDYVYAEPDKHYFCMNGYTGGWTKWDYSYNKGNEWQAIASPGSGYQLGQEPNSVHQTMFFTDFARNRLVYTDWKPKVTLDGSGDYHLDTNIADIDEHKKYYIPAVTIKTRASIGGSMLNYKKIYRTFMRFYLSDQSLPDQVYVDTWLGNRDAQTDLWTNKWTGFPEGLWSASINYNDYRFSVDQENEGNYLFYIYPNAAGKPLGNNDNIVQKPVKQSISPISMQTQNTNVYRRAYQIPIPQQRAVEFVFELKRRWSTITDKLINQDADRTIKQGYYFLLSGVWFEYNDKAGI